ncbi:MAG: hypothetical protein KC591_04990 [Gemmatimonadetes bacterium]|nr:hypothetical protein [Gemmatimonadota bacterium]
MTDTEAREMQELSLLEFRTGDVPEGAAARRPPRSAKPADARSLETSLRRFTLGGAAVQAGESAERFVPAALYPWLSRGQVRGDYPLFLALPRDGREELVVAPLATLLRAALDRLVPTASEERDSLERTVGQLERALRARLAEAAGPVDADVVLAGAGREILESQAIAGDERDDLRDQWDALLATLPDGGFLVDFSEDVSLHLLVLAALRSVGPRRAEFVREARDLASRVRGLLRADEARGDSGVPASDQKLGGRLGTAAAGRLDPSRFADITSHRHRKAGLGDERRHALERAAERLEALTFEGEPVLVLVHDGTRGFAPAEPAGARVDVVGENPTQAAVAAFADHAVPWLDVFRAVRLARLELSGRLDPSRHVPSLQDLALDGLRESEIGVLPVVTAVEEGDRLGGSEAGSLSRVLLSDWPIQILAVVEPGRVPFLLGEEPQVERLELAYLGLSHRHAFVQQSASARPEHLMEGFLRALDRPRPGLHVLARSVGAALDAEAALESRAHPFFRYDPDRGTTWAGRLDFSGNPSPELDWMSRRISVSESPEDGTASDLLELPFTFADYALLDTELDTHFRPVPDGVPDEALIGIDTYLGLSEDDQLRRIPTVWGVDDEGCLRRLAVTRRLARVTARRLDFWRTMQELAGVKNAYVEEAVQRVRAEIEARTAQERAALEAEHVKALRETERTAVQAAMSRLARRLLDLDLAAGLEAKPAPVASAAVPSPPAAAAPSEPEKPEAPAAEPPPAPAAAPLPEVEDPWIDSPLCTTCNDCINLNSLLFVYDSNKQATIGDAAKGTYAQLVLAAEKCPARCIHPGTPRDPNEPNLPELVQRAERFR